MKTLTVFQAEDGRRFDNEAAAVAHESACRRVEGILKTLLPRPDDLGHGRFIQQDRATTKYVKVALLNLARELHPNSNLGPYPDCQDEDIHPGSIVGRILDDYNSPVNKGWHRIYCIDEQGREWDQPYFALHPNKGNQEEQR